MLFSRPMKFSFESELVEKNAEKNNIPFMSENEFSEKDLIRLKAYGLSMATDATRPVMLFKEYSEKGFGELVCPVALNPMEAGVSISQASPTMIPSTPHKFTQTLLESLNIRITRAVFAEIRGHYQYLRLFFEGHPQQNSFKVRADEVMSLCLYLEIPFYATRQFVMNSRVLSAEMEGLQEIITQDRGVIAKKHAYLM